MALVLATAQVGCSIAFVKGRPDLITPDAPPDCTTSMIVPGVEAAISVTAVATSLFLGLGAAAKEGDLGPGETNYLAWATLYTFLGATALAVDSGIGGFKVRRCRRAHEEHRAMRNAPVFQPGYPGYGQPPPPQMPPPGFERGACRMPPAQPCEAGLACASGFCVRPPMQ
jgi:hypothetical protein